MPDNNSADRDLAAAYQQALEERAEAGLTPPFRMWWSLSRPDGGGIHMRVSHDGVIWRITDVYVHSRGFTDTFTDRIADDDDHLAQLDLGTITASDLQSVPITQLDLLMNLSADSDPWSIAEIYKELGQKIIEEPDDDPSFDELRELAGHAPAELPHAKTKARPKLTRPDGTDPEGFAARVADAYREYAPQTRAPALKIAEEAQVPVATARSWIREARRRGKLPAGRKGRAG
jgi:hypothetical protein